MNMRHIITDIITIITIMAKVYLKEPVKTNKKDYIYKIMLYQTKKDGVCLFMYCKKDA